VIGATGKRWRMGGLNYRARWGPSWPLALRCAPMSRGMNARKHAAPTLRMGPHRGAIEDRDKALHPVRRRHFDASVDMRLANNGHRRIVEGITEGAKGRTDNQAQAQVLQGRQRLVSTLDAPSTLPERRRA